jgi:hypothetical protein
MRGTVAAHIELAVADSDNVAAACMFMRDLVSYERTVMPRQRPYGEGYGTVPRVTIHCTGCPVTRAMRS